MKRIAIHIRSVRIYIRWFWLVIGLAQVSTSVIAQDLLDSWEWEVGVLGSGYEGFAVIDNDNNVITSPSRSKPQALILYWDNAGPAEDFIPISNPSCARAQVNTGRYILNYSFSVVQQSFSEPSTIPEMICVDDQIDFTIRNGGHFGHHYSFWAEFGGKTAKILDVNSLGFTPVKRFRYNFTEAALMELFDLSDPEDILGNYRFSVSVSTCPPEPDEYYYWNPVQLLAPPPEIEQVRGISPSCPDGEDGKIEVEYRNVLANTEFVYTIAKLAPSAGECTLIPEPPLDIDCNDPNTTCSNSNLTGSWCRISVANHTKVFEEGGNLIESINPLVFLDSDGESFLPLKQGVYEMRIETKVDGENLCDAQNFFVEIPPEERNLEFQVTKTSPLCSGNPGSIGIEVTNGIPPFTFIVDNNTPVTQNSIDFLAYVPPENYKVIVRDQCSADSIDVEIAEGQSLDITNIDLSQPTCSNDGSITIETEYDGTLPVQYQIKYGLNNSKMQSENVFNELFPGQYEVAAIIDGECVFEVEPVTLNSLPNISMGVDHRGQRCSDDEFGGMILYLPDGKYTGDSLSVSYHLQETTTGNIVEGTVDGSHFSDSPRHWVNVPPGGYTLTLENQCKVQSIFEGDFHILQRPHVSIDSIDTVVIQCPDGKDGIAEVIVSGGTGDYTITPASQSKTNLGNGVYLYKISGFGLGTHTVSVEDDCGIAFSRNFSVKLEEGVEELTLDQFQISKPISCGANDAVIWLEVAGGVPFDVGDKDYEVVLKGTNDPIIPDENFISDRKSFHFSNLAPDTYYPIVTDVNDCSKSFTDLEIEILAPPPLSIEPIGLSAFGGDQVHFDQANNLFIQCLGGRVDLFPQVNGGTGAYSFSLKEASWSAPLTDPETFQNLGAGFYHLTVQDGACEAQTVFTLNEPSELEILLTSDLHANQGHISCPGRNDAKITAEVQGGVPPYDYHIVGDIEEMYVDRFEQEWDFTELPVSPPSSRYQVTITDYLGCSVQSQITLESPIKPTFDYEIVSRTVDGYEIPCKGEKALLGFSASGGDEINGYRLVVDDIVVGAFDGDNTFRYDFSAGTYDVKIRDELDCDSHSRQLILREPEEGLGIETESISPNCIGGMDGSISVSASGGVAPYQFSLDHSSWQSENDFQGLEAGTYEILIQDHNECQLSANITVPPNPAPLSLELVTKKAPSCYHGTDGSITVQASNFQVKEGNALTFFITGGHYGNETENVEVTVDAGASEHNITFENLWDTKDPDFVENNYEIWVEDYFECEQMAFQYLGGSTLALEAPDPILLETSISPPSCIEGGDGWLVVSATGGVPPYYFSQDNLNFFPSNTADESKFRWNNLTSNTYQIFVRDSNFDADQPTCLASTQVQVPDGFEMTVVEQIQQLSCAGTNDGVIEVDIKSSYRGLPYNHDPEKLTLQWSFGDEVFSSSNRLENLSVGTYSLQMTYNQDTAMCSKIVEFSLFGPSSPLSIAQVSPFPTKCGQDGNGQAIIELQGGWMDSVNYYRLDGEQWKSVLDKSIFLDGLSQGNHYLEIAQSDFACLDAVDFTIEPSGILVETLFVESPRCSDGRDGQVILSASNVIDPMYEILDSAYQSSTGHYRELVQGKAYRFQVVSASNPSCSSEIIEFSFYGVCEDDTDELQITGTPIIQQVTCEEAADGVAEVFATGGLPPYLYLLDGMPTSESTLSNLDAGDHQLIVEDQLGKRDTTRFFIGMLSPLAISFLSTTKATCEGECDGSAIVLLEGGSGEYSIRWSDGEVDFQRNDLCPGVYDFEIFDARSESCRLSGQVSILQHEPLDVVLDSSTNPTCGGYSDGQIQVRASGGSGNHLMEWSHGETGPTLSQISSGSYEITVTDEILGCTISKLFHLEGNPPLLIADTIIIPPTCQGGNDGQVTLVIENDPSPLVRWHDGKFGVNRSNLKSGKYPFTVVSSKGCELSGEVILPERDNLAVEVEKSEITCNGDCGGYINLIISGGKAPYAVQWDSGERTMNRKNICKGSYKYEVVDRLGCMASGSVQIGAPEPLQILLAQKSNISCKGESDGVLEVIASGGVGPYEYTWSNNIHSALNENLGPDDYTVSISDANGCSTSQIFGIKEPQQIFLSEEIISNPSCDGSEDGSIEVITGGGYSPYSYAWSNGSTGNFIENLSPGDYRLLVEDSLGCRLDKVYGVEAPGPMKFVNVSVFDPVCSDEASGRILLDVVGGTKPYSFEWSSGHQTPTIQSLNTGQYEVTVTDQNGCIITSSFSLSNPPPVAISGIDDFITVCNNGSVFVSPDDNWAHYAWKGPNEFNADTPSIELFQSGDYSLTITDEKGCTASKDFEVEVSENILQADFIRISEPFVNEPLIFLDLSLPVPDQTNWTIPDSDHISVNSVEDHFMELTFTKPGSYELGLTAIYENCYAEKFKTIEVLEASDMSSTARTTSGRILSTKAYPNPAVNHINVIIDSESRDLVTMSLINMANEMLIQQKLKGKYKYAVHWDLSKLPSGVYILVFQSRDEFKQERLLVVR